MKHWIQAARLRTLPLSLSGIIVGSAYAYHQGFFNYKILALAFLTTLALQILSNYANDYGDGVKGTDVNRIGEKRMVAAGVISAKQMKRAVISLAIITLLLALSLIYVAFGKENFVLSLIFILLGISAIAAAIKYTVGSNAYGYNGLGDLFVFIFFGLVSVIGSNFLFTKIIDWQLLLPATTIGLLSVAVLNLNNMRDIENDRKAGKMTLVVKMGLANAKRYHNTLLTIASLSFLLFNLLTKTSLFPILLINLPIIMHINSVRKSTTYADFDPELKKVALSTFALSILFWLSLLL
ncbi:1,4-dihydroxy-2-naphthoate octaprenyltransferase [Flavobacterium sp. 9AF]|uniref:1,4-dihydroxy-2-naphthoate octaprenyltransferase n=1 Tax=Flavobacterium sp. 9AF TaxID=2653142 RepID=UPI0012F15838|nr:1,4-dihydroxy-2-naphthoate octaprenyltransferase [Flavobacterium sp. 9AF]VXB75848.1 1,4-dihydroxy-2-naphthoate octaprenyltransferase [Flavobacterium sp. 9AF]